ncbi:MAG TPA: flagellar hook protein FlgE [Rhodopila sp.]|uniref:flagellar hook protein FlgE n=1 Tax=Rhodopila sp. TaxID=2480087 RepID=UPI002C34FDBB|nr:flagellar hook protein FlgE [Rhodopila sp.]HVY16217.1 flagellar hook protein FlgE [Rhodopila sp.]
MSLFGSINTAISGLSAQSSAFGNISDNVANSQTVGYKRVDTSFIDYLTTSTPSQNQPGSVVAQPDYINNIQGAITQTDNPLGLAITGQGFFAVSETAGQVNGLPTFNAQQFYTRAGDFTMDKNGYLVNSAGQYLNGWSVNPQTGVADQNALSPIQISQTADNPVATSNVTLSANLPATPASGTATASSPISSQITVYDALGTSHVVNLNWVQNSANDWTVSIDAPDDTGGGTLGSAEVQFGAASANSVPAGTIGNITSATGSVTTSGYSAGQAATLQFSADFGSGTQPITLNLGTYGQTAGVTQYADTAYSLRGLTQNGVPPGAFSGVSMQTNGDVVVNYNNGQSRVIGQVPVVTFNNANALQRQNGQAFTSTTESGTPLAEAAGSNGAGTLVTGSVENSNVDIATEFSQLIVSQQAYSANAKVVTTADQLLQTTINMKN